MRYSMITCSVNLERRLAIKSSFAGAGSEAMLRGSTTGSGSATALPASHPVQELVQQG